MKPDNQEVVRLVERLAREFYEGNVQGHFFHFVFTETYCSHQFNPEGRVKSWIVQSRRFFSAHWRDAEAVMLSRRGRKNYSYDVVLKGSDQAFRLEVSLKTGDMSWRALNTQQAAELKEALRVAQR